jgi:hypothetical protein
MRRWAGVVVCSTLLWGCSMSKEGRDQALGGLLGAAAGAAIGAAAGRGDPAAIAAGAVGGAFVGWGAVKLAQYHAEKTASAKEAADVLGYTGAQGPLVKIRGARVMPGQVKRGERLTFETDYALVGSTKTGPIPVRETWELWKDNKLLTTVPPKTESREAGGWVTKASVDAPAKATPGTYVVKSRVEAGDTYDERTSVFTIT